MLYLKYHTLISLVNLGGGLMIKKLLFLSLVCFSLMSLSACSILPQSNTETETSAEKKKKKIPEKMMGKMMEKRMGKMKLITVILHFSTLM